MKGNVDGVLLIMCDDCESQWESPMKAQSYENVLKDEIRDVRIATLDEIQAAGWLTT
jgi:predicted alpha-1,6-mannanase (GH76 family)